MAEYDGLGEGRGMIRRTDRRPCVRNQSELDRFWQRWTRARSNEVAGTTCALVFADGRMTRKALTFVDIDGPLGDAEQHLLARWIRDLLDEETAGWSVAMLMTRPGLPTVDERDIAWAASLYVAARRAGVGCEVVHLAVGRRVLPLPLDALTMRRRP